MFTQDLLGDKDLSRHRIVELDNGNKVHLERRDPYGFIHAWLDKGAWPVSSALNGVFTSWERAYNAVDRYVSDRNAAVSEIREIAVESVKETVSEVKSQNPDYTIEATSEVLHQPTPVRKKG